MSFEFSCTRSVTGRKDHVCDQCMKVIPVGEKHSYSAGKFDGDFMTCREHDDCRALWLKLWKLRDLGYDDTQDMLINDGELWEDRGWITHEFPAVAARLWPSEAA